MIHKKMHLKMFYLQWRYKLNFTSGISKVVLVFIFIFIIIESIAECQRNIWNNPIFFYIILVDIVHHDLHPNLNRGRRILTLEPTLIQMMSTIIIVLQPMLLLAGLCCAVLTPVVESPNWLNYKKTHVVLLLTKKYEEVKG